MAAYSVANLNLVLFEILLAYAVDPCSAGTELQAIAPKFIVKRVSIEYFLFFAESDYCPHVLAFNYLYFVKLNVPLMVEIFSGLVDKWLSLSDGPPMLKSL